jgi:hypothetical protein
VAEERVVIQVVRILEVPEAAAMGTELSPTEKMAPLILVAEAAAQEMVLPAVAEVAAL